LRGLFLGQAGIFEEFLHGAFQLGIVPGEVGGGRVLDQDVRRDAPVLHIATVQGIAADMGDAEKTAVEQAGSEGEDDPAHRRGAEDFAEFQLLEAVGEDLGVAQRELIDKQKDRFCVGAFRLRKRRFGARGKGEVVPVPLQNFQLCAAPH
jgi:hypothetical protein